MKIGFISTLQGPLWGGSEELWSRAAEKMTGNGLQIGIYVYGTDSQSKLRHLSRLKNLGCSITIANPKRGRLAAKLVKKMMFQDTEEQSWLGRFKPDFVLVSNPQSFVGLDWMQACLHRHIPYAVLAQSALHQWRADGLMQSYRLALESAQACYFVCRDNQKLTEFQIGARLPRSKVISNAFNVAYDAHPPWPAGSVIKLACVARLEPRAKGQDILFEVLNQDRWRKRSLEVSLFGNGQNEQALRDLKKMLRLDRVHFAGFEDSIESIWASHHCLILPSRYEGTPLALIEAMLCRRPSIVTNIGGNAELVEDGETGFVAASAEARGLDEAMERAWSRKEEWSQIGERARQRVCRLIPEQPAQSFADELIKLFKQGAVSAAV